MGDKPLELSAECDPTVNTSFDKPARKPGRILLQEGAKLTYRWARGETRYPQAQLLKR